MNFDKLNCEYISRRNLALNIGAGLFGASALGGCVSVNNGARESLPPVVSLPNLNGRPRDEFLEAYNASMGVPLANFGEITLRAPDGKEILVRAAWPAVATTRLAIIAGCPDIGANARTYDMMSGPLASRGYVVLTISSTLNQIGQGRETPARRSFLRAGQISYVLDNLPKVLEIVGNNRHFVDDEVIGVAGHGEGAWTALELIGWGRGLIPSSSLADGRIRAAFALAPTQIENLPRIQDRSTARVIYGRALIASETELLPHMPQGSGILGVGLPPIAQNFGGVLGQRRADTRGRSPVPQRETLAAACASAALFFDWSLKGQRTKLDSLLACNGRSLEGVSRPLSVYRA